MLLQQKENAKICYEKLTDEEKKNIKDYPIMYLYEELMKESVG